MAVPERTSRLPVPAPDGDDWAVQAADTVERIVGTVRDRTTGPIAKVARVVVFGLLAAVVGTTAVTLLAIGSVRAINVYLPEDVWAAHLVVGGIFTLLGLLLWSRRRQSGE